MNRVFLCGRLGHSPDLRLSKNGKPYCRLSVATERRFMNKDDQWEGQSDWHSVFVWGPLAERCAHNYRKGALLFVEGALSYWKVAQPSGEEYKNAIHADRVNLIYQPAPAAEDSADGAKAARFGAETEEDLDIPPGPRNHNAVVHPA
jgi:single-strand DNA-binding protein